MSQALNVIWLGSDPVPENIIKAVGAEKLLRLNGNSTRSEQLFDADFAIIDFRNSSDFTACAPALFAELKNTDTPAGFVVDSPEQPICETIQIQSAPFVCIYKDSTPELILSMIDTARQLGKVIFDLKDKLNRKKITSTEIENIDHEMHLASRLQRDFLPSRLPELGTARFSVLFDPASFVSGDIYDVTRLDEKTLGFYVVDAVGHGMPAALLTMFIKNSLLQKHITENSYRIVPPNESLAQLNDDICSQELPESQFCTAVYATLDINTMQMTYCRAGHPEPILVRQNGKVELLGANGTLLGVFEEAQYESQTVQLEPGDRLIIFTDGLEDSLKPSHDSPLMMSDLLTEDLQAPREILLMNLTARLERAEYEGKVKDDVTVLVMDMENI